MYASDIYPKVFRLPRAKQWGKPVSGKIRF